MLLVWLEFGICVACIWLAGVRLSRYGDVIAEKTGLSRNWIGLILLATATSLPELATGISSVTLAQAPNIAVGDVLGACVMNLLMIVLLDFLHREESVYRRASQGHILSAGFSIILIGLVGFNVMIASNGIRPSFWHVGAASPVIVVLYLIAVRTVYRYEKEHVEAYAEEQAERYPRVTLGHASIGYGIAACIVVVTGTWLPFVGDQMARVMGWQQTFVGTLFVAFVTTLPEMAVTVSALRLGALDLAIGNLFGSNLFNIFILAVDDVCFRHGALLAHVSLMHAVSAASAMMMTGVAIVGLLYRPRARLLRTVGWASLFLLLLYLLNASVLYLYVK